MKREPWEKPFYCCKRILLVGFIVFFSPTLTYATMPTDTEHEPLLSTPPRDDSADQNGQLKQGIVP